MRDLLPIASGFDVAPLVAQLHRQPWLWNQHTLRTASPQSPHRELDDIWVRYNAAENYDPQRGREAFNEQHESVWYPAYYALPQIRALVFQLMALVQGERLGAVLLTRIPPGGKCYPHVDGGWHAEYFDKYVIQVMGGPDQSFNFDGQRLTAADGDVYWFNNLNKHWVINDSDRDRISLIVCIRSDRHKG